MLETNQIYLGDCYELVKQIADRSIDLVIIDPPYLIDTIRKSDKKRLIKNIVKISGELKKNKLDLGIKKEILTELMRVMKIPNIYIWCNKLQIPMYLDFFVKDKKCSFDILIWHKSNAMPLFSNKYLNDVEYCLYFRKNAYCKPTSYNEAKTVFEAPLNIKNKESFHHPTIKPMKIIETLIKNSSRENEIVLDCFLGSGTTAVACQNLNRQFIGIEINPI